MGPCRVLIVDDDDDGRQLVVDFLAELGYEMLAARNGVERLELLRQHRPALVLLDIDMP